MVMWHDCSAVRAAAAVCGSSPGGAQGGRRWRSAQAGGDLLQCTNPGFVCQSLRLSLLAHCTGCCRPAALTLPREHGVPPDGGPPRRRQQRQRGAAVD